MAAEEAPTGVDPRIPTWAFHPRAAVAYAGIWGAEDPAAADTDDSRWLYCAVARRP